MRLLLTETTHGLRGVLAELLAQQGYAVDPASSVAEALEAIALASYDLILLDLSLSDGDGRKVLRAVRSGGDGAPVLAMSKPTDVQARIEALDAGADDYLEKPFAPNELLARIRALLRRPRLTLDSVITAGNVSLDTASRVLLVDEATVDMPRREITVLEALMRNRGRLVARRALEGAVYPFDSEVSPNAIEAAVSRVRRRLDDKGASITINAMRGQGYLLTERLS